METFYEVHKLGKKNDLRITVSYHFLVRPEDFNILDKGISEMRRQQVYQCWRQEVRAPRTAVSLMTLGSEGVIYLSERQLLSLKMSFFELCRPALKRYAAEESSDLGILSKNYDDYKFSLSYGRGNS